MSDIFDSYAKIAEERGLVSKSEDSPKLKRYKKQTNPRAGSDTIETIEALYGVKPSSSIEYENNIMEAAHPKSVVIAPSYDRINGLVENNIERNNIMCNIALKPNNGDSTNHRFASKELMMELVRIANDMDNRNHSGLQALADTCIDALVKKKSSDITKQAFLPIVAGMAAILVASWVFSHTDDPDNGLAANIENSLAQLNDLKTNSWYESDVDDTVQRDVSILERHLNALRNHVFKFNSVMDRVYSPYTLSDINKLRSVSMKAGSAVDSSLDDFKNAVQEITPALTTAINNFTSTAYQKQHTKPSWLGDVSGWVGEGLHGRWGLIANDFISAANALNALKKSLKEAYNKAGSIDELKDKYEEDLTEEVNQMQRKPEKKAPRMEEEEPSDDEANDLVKMLGYKPSAKEMAFFQSL